MHRRFVFGSRRAASRILCLQIKAYIFYVVVETEKFTSFCKCEESTKEETVLKLYNKDWDDALAASDKCPSYTEQENMLALDREDV